MNDISSILVTGGAGYVGSVLVTKLVKLGYKVRVIDSLIYGNEGISKLISNNSIEMITEDLRNNVVLSNVVKNIDCVIHLAAIVGEPLCNKIPDAAYQINEIATKNLVSYAKKSGVKRFIFASTCSNYGSSAEIVNEDSPTQPLSLYSKTKLNAEKFIINSKDNSFEPCILRFATAHGLSPRMRFDLLLQEFLRDALIEKKISIFGQDFWRPFIHVEDMADACISVARASSDLISGEIFNVGSDDENYTKKQLAKIIQEFIQDTEIEILKAKTDPRNYKVSFEKIKNSLNFKIKKSVKDSIYDILQENKSGNLNPSDSDFTNMSRLTEKIHPLSNYQFDENL